MSRTMETLPALLQCEACLKMLAPSKFRHDTSSQAQRARGWHKHIVADVCKVCQGRRSRGQLSAEVRARYDAVTARNKAQMGLLRQASGRELHARAQARKDEVGRKVRESLAARRGEQNPFDATRELLEKEWGIPAAQWTLDDDRQHTLRMYDYLGWPRDSFLRGNTANVARKQTGAQRDD